MTSDSQLAPPPASGVRLPWSGVPAELRAAAERELGSAVTAAVTQSGGFSPGVAARVRLANGRRAFVKAVSAGQNPDSPGIHRAEARIAAALPASTPAPRFLGCVDQDDWVVLMFEDIEGHMPAQPWRADELDRVLAAMADLACSLDPAPIDAPSVVGRTPSLGCGWSLLAEAAQARTDDLAGLDPWARDRLALLVAIEAGWADAASGEALVHSDIRADNILLTHNRVVFVDWPWACLAARWLDLVAMLPSVQMQGGPPAEQVFARHPVSKEADPDAVTAAITALAGFFVWQSRQLAPPGLPTLRAFQAAQGETALDWLQTRLASS
jgi:aminoglycoside phosphotransferase (APT) family kinase protein